MLCFSASFLMMPNHWLEISVVKLHNAWQVFFIFKNFFYFFWKWKIILSTHMTGVVCLNINKQKTNFFCSHTGKAYIHSYLVCYHCSIHCIIKINYKKHRFFDTQRYRIDTTYVSTHNIHLKCSIVKKNKNEKKNFLRFYLTNEHK